jgi:hypothetical protein
LSFDCVHLVIQGMNPINIVAADIYHWSKEDTAIWYGVASSISLLMSILVLVYPSYYLLQKIGRLNSIRISFALIIVGCCLMLIRHTAAITAGRALHGVAMGVQLFNSIPYIINCVP